MTEDRDGGKSFAELFEESMEAAPTRFEPGQEVSGTLLQIGQEYCFLDIGAKGEALIATGELLDKDDNFIVDVGEVVDARVLRQGREGLVVSRVLQGGAQSKRVLEEAHQLEMPVEGVVQKVIKGGLEVEVAGTRAFCPASQIALHYVEDLEEFVGQKLTFRVSEYREGGRTVVLSRKVLLAAERERHAKQTRKLLEVGAVLKGTVSNIRDFGAFVDLGGVEGLLHISEISYTRVDRVEDVLSQGEAVEVKIIKMEGDRLSLSMKALAGNPWDHAAERFAEATRHKGRVVRVQPFGAFVELAPGVDGLLHVSTLDDPRIRDARRVFEAGQELEVAVVSFDAGRKRIGLAPADRVSATPTEVRPGALVTGTVERVEHYGVFLRLPGAGADGRSARGLIPRDEIRSSRDDLRSEFPLGAEVRVQVLEPDDKGRMRLSQRAALDAHERAQASAYLEEKKPSSGGGLGTLGDLLKQKLQK